MDIATQYVLFGVICAAGMFNNIPSELQYIR